MANQPIATEYTKLSEGREMQNNIARALNILSQLNPFIEEMERLIGIQKRFQMLLYEPELLFKYRKNWIALLIATRLFNNYRTLKTLKSEDIRKNIEEIRVYDKGLAENIEKMLPFVEKETRIFSDLLDALSNGKNYFVNYISTHLTELITKAKSIKDESLSKQIVSLFSAISGHEVDYLIKYRIDADNWVNYIIGNGIEFFMRRLNLYLKGGIENNTQFMGLYKDFGDVELTRTMLKDNEIKNLWRFNEQLRYLNLLIELCKKSETSGEWEGFWGKRLIWDEKAKGGYGFWGEKGDKNGKNFDKHAELFETKYGNDEFTRLLKAQKWQIGENPDGWGGVWQGNRLVKPGFLHQLLARLQHPTYQRQKIILPASLVLHKIFKEREDKLRADRDKYVDELIKLLQEAEGIGVAKEKIIKKFARLLERKKKILLDELSSDMAELLSKSNDSLLAYVSISKEQEKVLGKITPYYLANVTGRLVGVRNLQLAFIYKNLETGQFLKKNDIGGLTSMGIAGKLAEELQARKLAYERFEHLSEDDFDYLQKLIPTIRDVIRKLRSLYGYIRFKMQQKHTIKVEYLQNDLEKLEQDLEKAKNKDFKFGHVKEMVDRLI